MNTCYKNELIALLITIVIVIGGLVVVNDYNKYNSNDIYTSKNKTEINSSNEIDEEDSFYNISNEENNMKEVLIVIEDTSSAVAIEASNVGTDIVVDTTASSDNQTLQYFHLTENKIDSIYDNIDKIKIEGKALFVKLVDFIFYDTEINGIKFSNISTATQDKIVAVVNCIDSKIESKIPGYKETVTDYAGKTYSYLSDKLKQGITYLDTKIDENVNSDTYVEAKKETGSTIDTIKESLGTAIDISKETLTAGKDKLQNWYEGWK